MSEAPTAERNFAEKCIRAEAIVEAQRRFDRAARKLQEANAALHTAEKEFGEASRALETLSDDK